MCDISLEQKSLGKDFESANNSSKHVNKFDEVENIYCIDRSSDKGIV